MKRPLPAIPNTINIEEICQFILKKDNKSQKYMQYYIQDLLFNRVLNAVNVTDCTQQQSFWNKILSWTKPKPLTTDNVLSKLINFADNIYNLLINENVNINSEECKNIKATIICNKNLYILLSEYNKNTQFIKGKNEQALLTQILKCIDKTHLQIFDSSADTVTVHHI